MKKIAAVLHRNVDFNSMFQRESPFVKRTTYWPFMLKEELERQRYQLVPYQKAESYGSMEAFFHIDRLRKDVLKKYPGKCHIYLGFEPAVVEPAHRKKAVKRLAAGVYDAVLTTHTDVTGERIFPMAYPADITYIRDEDKIPDRLACLFSGNKTGFGKELYSLRRKVIRFAEKNRIKDFAFFGTGWTPPYSRYQSYQGCAEDKYEAALPYKFSFCFENEFGMRGGLQKKFLTLCVWELCLYIKGRIIFWNMFRKNVLSITGSFGQYPSVFDSFKKCRMRNI